MFKKMITSPIIAVVLFLGLAACSHTPPVADYPATANPNDEINKLDADLHAAYDRQANALSPRNYSKASDYFGDAKIARDKGKDNSEVLKKVAISRAYLNQAEKVVGQVEEKMPAVTKARRDAIAGGALHQQKEEMKEADSDLKDVTEDMEKGKMEVSQDTLAHLKDRYLDIEVAAISRTRLSEARNLISKARKQRAEKLAPRTLQAAEQKVKQAEDAITTDRHNNELLDHVTADATNEARHLLNITNMASQAKGESPEQVALDMDARTKALQSKDQQLAATTQEGAMKDQTLSEKDRELAALAGTNSSLEKEKKFNETFEAVQKQFDPNEAEVYRQGDNLLLRLKGLKFTSGRSELNPKALPILSKVKDVLAEVKTDNVVVEGHTDGVGAKDLNQKLSSQRADAVAKYLVSEKAVEEDKIKSEGYGFSKPLASNKSPEGRAQNRRVDVIMTLTK